MLTLVALLTGLVAPRLWQWVEGARLRAGVDLTRAELEAMPARAFAAARRIDTSAERAVLLPEGWRLDSPQPLVYEANGMTEGARVRVSDGTRVLADWVVEAPAGTVRDARPDDGPFRGAAP